MAKVLPKRAIITATSRLGRKLAQQRWQAPRSTQGRPAPDMPRTHAGPVLAPAPLLALLGLVLLAQAPGLRSQREADMDPLTLPLERLRLPPGFSAELYTEEHVKSARHMALGLAQGNMTIVYVSSVEKGSVYALLDRDFDGYAEVACPILTGLQTPNGIVWHRGRLYVAETPRIRAWHGIDFAVLNGCDPSLLRETTVMDGLPPQAGHPARALALGPDGRLYFSVAAPFNVGDCGTEYCTLRRVELNGTGFEVFARGIRNVGGLAWSPDQPGRLYYTVLERDQMGNDMPDDLVQSATLQGGTDYRFPYCHWVGTGDPVRRDLGPGVPLADDTMTPAGVAANGGPRNDTVGPWCAANAPPPVQAMGPHVSPLGLVFYPTSPQGLPAQAGGPWPVQMFPRELQGRLFVAQHGSWNREVPIGYRVMSLQLSSEGRPTAYEPFAEGWLQPDRSVWGRPVGLLVMPDGSMLVAGDQEGAIYRVWYDGLDF